MVWNEMFAFCMDSMNILKIGAVCRARNLREPSRLLLRALTWSSSP